MSTVWLPEGNGFALAVSSNGADPLDFAIEQVRVQLPARGAILFRGFGVDTPAAFGAFCTRIAPDQPSFKEESSPRTQVSGAVFTSTDYDAKYPIQFHNEYSYSREWPMKLFFGCATPPTTEGATPVADTRRILARLSASTRRNFEEKGVLYTRNYLPRMGVSWRTAFGTDARAEVEAYCRSVGITWEWKPGDVLTTRQRGPAVVAHPHTNDAVWFNHAFFFNVQGLEPDSLRETMLDEPEEDLSTNTSYGDGSPIEVQAFDEIRGAYKAERIRFDWEKGDVLLIDNMLMSHGREPYSGPRKILVTMADPWRRSAT